MDIAALGVELKKPAYAALDDQAAADALNALPATTRVVSRFGSFRTAANLLTAEQYAAFKTALASVASTPVVADMIEFLKLPGDEVGNGGGIDFGATGVRAMLDALVAGGMESSIATALKSYAEESVSFAGSLFVETITAGMDAEARKDL